MSFPEQSYVWPADYNWHHVTHIPNNNFNHYTAPNASHWLPWFISLWTVGVLKPNIKENLEPEEDVMNGHKEVWKDVISWKQIDIEYPSHSAKTHAMKNGHFIPENNLPLGLQTYKERIFVSLPKWKEGVPVTLGVIRKNEGSSPVIKPYPNWSWYRTPPCQGLTSVFRMDVDVCNRLWVLDSGIVDAENSVNQTCPPQLFVFHLETDKLLWRYTIPEDQSLSDSLFGNIVVEILNNDCLDAYAYLGDIFRYGLVVYSLKLNQSWRLTHAYFYPDPLASDYILDKIRFQWVDGIFGLALSPPDTSGNRKLYFHPLSSYREFAVPTYILRNSSLGFRMNDYFEVVGEPRGDSVSHATGSAMDRDGVLFYNLLTKSAIGCWNSRTKVYNRRTQGVIYQNNETLSFPNDMRIDLEPEQSVWVLSNKLHKFLYDRLNPKEVNFHILMGKTKDVVKGSVCQQNINIPPLDPNDKCTS